MERPSRSRLRRRRQSLRWKNPGPPSAATSSTQARRAPGSSKNRSASEVRGSEHSRGVHEGSVAGEEIAAGVVYEGHVHGVVSQPIHRRQEPLHLGRRMDPGVGERVAVKLEDPAASESGDLLPGKESPVPHLPCEDRLGRGPALPNVVPGRGEGDRVGRPSGPGRGRPGPSSRGGAAGDTRRSRGSPGRRRR